MMREENESTAEVSSAQRSDILVPAADHRGQKIAPANKAVSESSPMTEMKNHRLKIRSSSTTIFVSVFRP